MISQMAKRYQARGILPGSIPLSWFSALCLSITVFGYSQARASGTNRFITQPLSLADSLNLALEQNPALRRARKEIEAAQGVVIQTRAVVLPRLKLTGAYNALQDSDVDKPPVNIPGFTFGTDQNWNTQIRVVQSIYEGGRMSSALRAGRLTEERAVLNYQSAAADTVAAVQIAYYDALLGQHQIKVQEASIELLSRELADTRRRFEAGTVPRFNVLRAEVELANAQPRLIRARNVYRIAKNNLANLLGFDVPHDADEDIPLNLSDRLQAEPYGLEMSSALRLALERRPELGALRKTEALSSEDIVTARSGSKPTFQAYAGYDAHSSIFRSDLTSELNGWIAGVQLNWDIFDGLRTQGRVKEATARKEQAGIELEDAGRRIELEVRTAFSNFREAEEVMKSQEKVVEQADEALRLAASRSEAGAATQLDVLSAQTALTEARTTQIQALHDYAVARARLERAVGANVVKEKAK